MKQILCLSTLPWQAVPNRTQQLLTRLSDVQILFFEPAPAKGAPSPEQGRRMRANLTVYTLPVPLPNPRDGSLTYRRRLDRAADFIQQTMDRHRFREPVLWCSSPRHAAFLDRLAYRGLVYDCSRPWDDRFQADEQDLARHAEVVFAASPGLARRLAPFSDNIALLPNGVNPLLFSADNARAPADLSVPPGQKLLGRLGDLDGSVDLEPLLYAARRRPEWTFLLIGRYTRQASRELAGQDNIRLLGQVNALDVPEYLSACHLLFDLRSRDGGRGDVTPARIYEYLASGKPVVAVAAPDVPEPFPELVYTAYDGPGFLRRCRAALSEDPALPRQRREHAAKCSWSCRAAQVSAILEDAGLFQSRRLQI